MAKQQDSQVNVRNTLPHKKTTDIHHHDPTGCPGGWPNPANLLASEDLGILDQKVPWHLPVWCRFVSLHLAIAYWPVVSSGSHLYFQSTTWLLLVCQRQSLTKLPWVKVMGCLWSKGCSARGFCSKYASFNFRGSKFAPSPTLPWTHWDPDPLGARWLCAASKCTDEPFRCIAQCTRTDLPSWLVAKGYPYYKNVPKFKILFNYMLNSVARRTVDPSSAHHTIWNYTQFHHLGITHHSRKKGNPSYPSLGFTWSLNKNGGFLKSGPRHPD